MAVVLTRFQATSEDDIETLFEMLEISMNIQTPDPHGTYTLEFAAVLSVLEKV